MCVAEGVDVAYRVSRFNGAHRKYGMHCERNSGVSHSKTAHSLTAGMQYGGAALMKFVDDRPPNGNKSTSQSV